MSNVLVHVTYVVDVPEEKVAALVGRPDDESQGWWEKASDRACDWVRDNLPDVLESTGEPEVEA
jgi:hypothetical protein